MAKLFGILFCGVFAAAGIGLFVSSGLPMISGWMQAKSWHQVQAELIDHDLASHRGDDSTTYEVSARYRYDYLGQRFNATKVSFSSGADNIGSYHQDMNDRLSQVARGAKPLMVWVNPDKPSEAVIDREMRWGLLAFKSLFLFLFGGFGLGGLYAMYRFRNLGDVLPEADPSRPWTNYAQWNKSTLLSSVKLGNKVMLGFAIFWNLISWPALFAIVKPVSNGEYAALFVLIFPIIGAYLIHLWYKGHRSFKRTGPMPLELNPYPASIGGQAGGIIYFNNGDINKTLKGVSSSARVTIENVHYYRSGSGKERKTRERVLFEKSMVPSIAITQQGSEIRFCFDLDDTLPISGAPLDMPRKAWRIRFTAKTDDGLEVERIYQDVPVFATAQRSSIADTQAYASRSTATLDATADLLESVLDLIPDERGQQLYYPAYRNKSMMGFIVAGLFTAGIGFAIPDLIFNIIFPLVGGILFLVGIYAFANSLKIRIGAEGISAQRSLFGYQFKPQFVPSYSFKEFKKKVTSSSQVGNKTTIYYKIVAHGNQGEKAIVAEGLAGMQQADAAIEKLKSLI